MFFFSPFFGVNLVFVLESDGCGRPPRRSPHWYNGQEGERPSEEEEGRLQADAGAHHDGLGTRDADGSTIERHTHIGFPWKKKLKEIIERTKALEYTAVWAEKTFF